MCPDVQIQFLNVTSNICLDQILIYPLNSCICWMDWYNNYNKSSLWPITITQVIRWLFLFCQNLNLMPVPISACYLYCLQTFFTHHFLITRCTTCCSDAYSNTIASHYTEWGIKHLSHCVYPNNVTGWKTLKQKYNVTEGKTLKTLTVVHLVQSAAPASLLVSWLMSFSRPAPTLLKQQIDSVHLSGHGCEVRNRVCDQERRWQNEKVKVKTEGGQVTMNTWSEVIIESTGRQDRLITRCLISNNQDEHEERVDVPQPDVCDLQLKLPSPAVSCLLRSDWLVRSWSIGHINHVLWRLCEVWLECVRSRWPLTSWWGTYWHLCHIWRVSIEATVM